jgi:hypothetical protein
MSEHSVLFDHHPHPLTLAHSKGAAPPPPKVNEERVGFNGKLGLFITTIVGTTWAAVHLAGPDHLPSGPALPGRWPRLAVG